MGQDKEIIGALGVSSEMLQILAKLGHQIKKQGGEVNDLGLLGQDKILERVAKVLARVGRLTRPFDVWMKNGPYSWVKIFLIGLKISSISEFTGNTLPEPCRLVTKAELEVLWQDNFGIFQAEDDLVIIGKKVCGNDKATQHCAITKNGPSDIYLYSDSPIDENYLFATTFDPIKN